MSEQTSQSVGAEMRKPSRGRRHVIAVTVGPEMDRCIQQYRDHLRAAVGVPVPEAAVVAMYFFEGLRNSAVGKVMWPGGKGLPRGPQE